MIISEKKLRKIVKNLVLEFEIGRISSRTDSKLIDAGTSDEGEFEIGDYKYEFQGSGKYVMPAPIFNGTDYSQKITSPPQATRVDVHNVSNSSTGETKERGDHPHRGYDFGTPVGTPIVAFAGGVVSIVNTNPSKGGGNYIYIDHTGDGNIKSTGYLHLSKILVKKEDEIKAGQVVGLSGETGNITGPHLHFSIKKQSEEKSSHDKSFYDNMFKSSKKVKITKKEESLSKNNTSNNNNNKNNASSEPGKASGDESKINLPSGKPGSEITKNIDGKDIRMKKWQGFPYAVEVINADSRQFVFYSRSGKDWSVVKDPKIIKGLEDLM